MDPAQWPSDKIPGEPPEPPPHGPRDETGGPPAEPDRDAELAQNNENGPPSGVGRRGKATRPAPTSSTPSAAPHAPRREPGTGEREGRPIPCPRRAPSRASPCPAGVHTYRYSQAAGTSTPYRSSGARTCRHSATQGHTNTARPTHPSPAPIPPTQTLAPTQAAPARTPFPTQAIPAQIPVSIQATPRPAGVRTSGTSTPGARQGASPAPHQRRPSPRPPRRARPQSAAPSRATRARRRQHGPAQPPERDHDQHPPQPARHPRRNAFVPDHEQVPDHPHGDDEHEDDDPHGYAEDDGEAAFGSLRGRVILHAVQDARTRPGVARPPSDLPSEVGREQGDEQRGDGEHRGRGVPTPANQANVTQGQDSAAITAERTRASPREAGVGDGLPVPRSGGRGLAYARKAK